MAWSLFRSRHSHRRPAPRRPRLGCELMEDRVVPATSLDTGLRFAVGVLENGAAHVRVYDSAGTQLADVDVSDLAGTGQPGIATADVTGDGTADIVIGSGAGVASQVRVLDGKTFQQAFSASPFGSFTGGVNVSAGDLTGDGKAEVVASPDAGGGPRLVIYRGGDFQPIASFMGMDDANFRGGVRTAVADVNHDGHPDLVVAAGLGGGPRVAIFDGTTPLSGSPTKLVNDFFALDPSLRNGVYVAAGDVNGDGFADLAFGAGPGGAPRVLVVSGQTLTTSGITAALGSPLANFFAGNPAGRAGVQVQVRDLNGDGKADVIAGSLLTAGGTLTAYSGQGLTTGALTTLFNLLSVPAAGSVLSGLTSGSTGTGTGTGTGTTPGAGNPLVTLSLNPLDINLLGLEVQTSPITVTVSALPGNGELLGNVLTLASNLINLQGVNTALNNVLGGVVTLLNSAGLSVAGANTTSGPFSTAAAATTPVLDLFVAPVHLNLLGALVDTSPIHLTITAHSGPGLVLGNVVTDLANLFNPPLPAQLDLTTINAKLQQLLADLNTQLPGIPSAPTTAATIPAGSSQVLALTVPPINLNLLGLNLQTSQIQVNADALTGNGLLLGNVLTTLLNTLGATPGSLTDLNNNLNALLAKVVGVLNAASLTLAPGALNALAPVLQNLSLPGLVNTTGAPATTPILNLAIASPDGTTPPVDVNLLGLKITTSNIRATLSATTGDGQVLGNLLYNVANLLNPGGTLNLLTILGQLGV
ncbi:MAG: Cadherin domain protein [Gemmataceae bacterium]|nr:Cadherin domain protein [Gemmataceae bacterium]